MWWLVYIEGEGQYCLKNPQNKKEFFSAEPSTRLKKDCLEEHIVTKRHKDAITDILMNKLSVLQKKLDHNAEVQLDVYQSFPLSPLVGKGRDSKCEDQESVEIG